MSPEALSRLQSLFASENIPVYMSSSEGGELAAAGLIGVNPDDKQGESFRVQITDAGVQAVIASSQPVAPPMPAFPGYAPPTPQQTAPVAQVESGLQQTKPTFNLATNIAIPKIKRGNPGNLTPRESVYPFDVMEIGQSFHVPVTEQNKEPHKRMASNVSAANRRYETEVTPQVMETVTKKRLIKGDDGKTVTGPDGKKMYEEYTETAPKTQQTRRFLARRTDNSDPNGPGVRIFRVELDHA